MQLHSRALPFPYAMPCVWKPFPEPPSSSEILSPAPCVQCSALVWSCLVPDSAGQGPCGAAPCTGRLHPVCPGTAQVPSAEQHPGRLQGSLARCGCGKEGDRGHLLCGAVPGSRGAGAAAAPGYARPCRSLLAQHGAGRDATGRGCHRPPPLVPPLGEKELTAPSAAAALKFITCANCFEVSDSAANGKCISG